MWENPAFADFLHRLASFSRLILFDRLGNGMSDRGPTGHAFEDWMDDVRAVLAAVGSRAGRILRLPPRRPAGPAVRGHPPGADHGGGDLRVAPRDPARRRLPVGRDRPRNGRNCCERPGRAPWTPSSCWPTSRRARRPTPPRVGGGATYWHSAASPPEALDEILALGPVDIRGLLGSVRAPDAGAAPDRGPDGRRARPAATWPSGCPQARLRRAAGRGPLPVLRRPGRRPGADPGVPDRDACRPSSPTGCAHRDVHRHRRVHRAGDRAG